MILELLVHFFVGYLLNPILEFLPTIDVTFPVDVIDTIISILQVGMYFLPMGTVVTILTLVVQIFIFRIGISLLRTIWGFIPFL